MKCPRCQSTMKLRRFKNNRYNFICPKCNYTVGQKESSKEVLPEQHIADTTEEE